MDELEIGAEYALRLGVVGVKGVEDRYEFGILVGLSGHMATLRTQHGDWEQPAILLHRVATSPRRAQLGDLLVQDGKKPLLINVLGMLDWIVDEELLEEQERAAKRREEQAAARAERRQTAEAAEARNRAKRERRGREQESARELAELGFVIDETDGLRFVGVK